MIIAIDVKRLTIIDIKNNRPETICTVRLEA